MDFQLKEYQEGNKSATITIDHVENSVEHISIATNPPITKTKGRRKEDIRVSKNRHIKSGLKYIWKTKKPKR